LGRTKGKGKGKGKKEKKRRRKKEGKDLGTLIEQNKPPTEYKAVHPFPPNSAHC
jgi:hypothetical protein